LHYVKSFSFGSVASDKDLGRWMQWPLTAHVRRYHQHYRSSGHVWQGRFKAFPIGDDDHLLTVLRYVERNPLRAGLVEQAENWRWSSLHHWRTNGSHDGIDPGPVLRPERWIEWVNQPLSPAVLDQIRHNINRGTPYGSAGWVSRMATQLGLSASLRPRGRPRKEIEI
jgi:putative transposase